MSISRYTFAAFILLCLTGLLLISCDDSSPPAVDAPATQIPAVVALPATDTPPPTKTTVPLTPTTAPIPTDTPLPEPSAVGFPLDYSLDEVVTNLQGLPINVFFERSYEYLLVRDPELMTAVGMSERLGLRNDRLNDLSADYAEETHQLAPGDLVALFAIGLLGIFMRRFDWSRPAFLIGFVLSTQAENYSFQAYQIAMSKFRLGPASGWNTSSHPSSSCCSSSPPFQSWSASNRLNRSCPREKCRSVPNGPP